MQLLWHLLFTLSTPIHQTFRLTGFRLTGFSGINGEDLLQKQRCEGCTEGPQAIRIFLGNLWPLPEGNNYLIRRFNTGNHLFLLVSLHKPGCMHTQGSGYHAIMEGRLKACPLYTTKSVCYDLGNSVFWTNLGVGVVSLTVFSSTQFIFILCSTHLYYSYGNYPLPPPTTTK